MRLNQVTLAGMVGASRENTNRALARLERQGVIRREGGWPVLLALPGLATRQPDVADERLGIPAQKPSKVYRSSMNTRQSTTWPSRTW